MVSNSHLRYTEEDIQGKDNVTCDGELIIPKWKMVDEFNILNKIRRKILNGSMFRP